MGCQYWQVASVAGKVPKWVKVPEPKHRAIARCEVCVSMYITYISVSKSTPLAVTGPHGQLASNSLRQKLGILHISATSCQVRKNALNFHLLFRIKCYIKTIIFLLESNLWSPCCFEHMTTKTVHYYNEKTKIRGCVRRFKCHVHLQFIFIYVL